MNQQNSDAELARISSFILAGLFALMSFIMVVGVQTLPNNIQKLMFASIGLLGANIVVFAVRNLVGGMGDGKKKGARILQNVRIGQHLLFVVSIGVVVWLGIAVGQFFYKPVNEQQTQDMVQQQLQEQQQAEQQTAPQEAPAPTQ